MADDAKPVAAEPMSEHIDSPVVASSETAPATTRACLFVRLSLPHCRKPDELRNRLFTVRSEEGCEVLSDPCLAMPQFPEGQGPVSFKMRTAVQVGDNTSLDKSEE